MNSHSSSVSWTLVAQDDLPDRAPQQGRIPQIDHNSIRALEGLLVDRRSATTLPSTRPDGISQQDEGCLMQRQKATTRRGGRSRRAWVYVGVLS